MSDIDRSTEATSATATVTDRIGFQTGETPSRDTAGETASREGAGETSPPAALEGAKPAATASPSLAEGAA